MNINKNKVCAKLIIGIMALLLFAIEAAEIDVQISEAWIPEAPPVVTTMAGYFKLRNGSNQTVTLVGVSSPAFGKVELHRTEINDGVARMVRQERIDVPSNETFSLEPGSFHLMLMKPVKPLTEGDAVQLQLQLENGAQLDFTAMVKKAKH